MRNKYLKFIPKLSLKLKWKTGTVFCAPGEIDRSNKSPELMDGYRGLFETWIGVFGSWNAWIWI